MASAVGQALIFVAVVIVLLWMSFLAFLAVVAMRGVRRLARVGRTWTGGQETSVGTRGQGAGSVRASACASATIGSAGWWIAQRDRHRMWRAVSSAGHAVGVAQRAGAPVGDLPSLARELERAARHVDAVLRASARSGSMRREVRYERVRIEAAAADLHRAALESLATVADVATEDVVTATRIERDALSAGLGVVRKASGHPSR